MNDTNELLQLIGAIALTLLVFLVGAGSTYCQFKYDAENERLHIFNNKVYKFIEVKP